MKRKTIEKKKEESIREPQCSEISWYGYYYITLLLINITSYLPEEQTLLRMHPSLANPSLLCAVASDDAVGKGRGLLRAVLNHGYVRTSYSPEETLAH